MKIAILLPNLGGGGAERISLDLAREFAWAGHEVEFVLLRAEGEFLPEAEKTSIAVVDLGIDRIRRLPRALSAYLSRSRPDALIATMWPLTPLAVLARILSGHRCRLMLAEHNMLSIQYEKHGWLHRLILRLTMALGYRGADAVLGVSEGVVDDMARLAALPARRLHVVHNPIAQPAMSDAVTLEKADKLWGVPRGDRILAVGRFKAQKNYPLLLRAFAKLPSIRDARLMLLGTGEEEAELRALAGTLGAADRVIFAGFQPDPAPFYRTADLFVLSSDHEGLPTVIIEALACGLPVVSTDCPAGPAEILERGKYGALVPMRDESALAEAMATALAQNHDPELLRARAQDFSSERAAAHYLALLSAAPNGRASTTGHPAEMPHPR